TLSACGKTLPVLTELEDILVDEAKAWLEEEHPEDVGLMEDSFLRLHALGEAVFTYPSIRDTKFLRGVVFDEKHLIESLLSFSSASQLLRTPTKVVVMRGFLVAKFHAFAMLASLTAEHKDLHSRLRKVVFTVISTLVAEAVYFSCIDEPDFPHELKSGLAEDLVELWDRGVDTRGMNHFSALSSLWMARNSSPPNFGTMDGNTELLLLTMTLDEGWREFLMKETDNDQTRWALEEFIFGLSWEEIQKVRARIVQDRSFAVGVEGIRCYLSPKSAFSRIKADDPRTFYDFFIERRDSCKLRKRLATPGPTCTLEEIYLKYRILMEPR
ncbi:MAG: hypothetical protein FWD94_07885, partial [Treponema sp.]|nr:hypothetical protein [Treponema sp.]